jgi:hypothetical protein
MERLTSMAVLLLSLSSAAYANDSGTRPPSMDALLGGIVQERDVGLVFDYLRDALRAAVDGREAPQPPDELTRRGEAIGDEMKRRGASAAQAVLDAIEKSVRESMREPRRLPPSSSAQRI